MKKRRDRAEILQLIDDDNHSLLEMHGIVAWFAGIGLKPKKDWDLRIPKVKCKHCGRHIKDHEICWYDGNSWGVYCNDCISNYYDMAKFDNYRIEPLEKEELTLILEKQGGKVEWYEREVLDVLKKQQQFKTASEKLMIGLKQM